jgi:hypothetical protein
MYPCFSIFEKGQRTIQRMTILSWWFFEGFEVTITDGSLILILQIPRKSDSYQQTQRTAQQ